MRMIFESCAKVASKCESCGDAVSRWLIETDGVVGPPHLPANRSRGGGVDTVC